MVKPRHAILALAIWIAACTPIATLTPTPSLSEPSPTPTPSPAMPPTAAPLNPLGRIILRYSSFSLTVEDPAQTLLEIQELVQNAGGFVTSASSYSTSEGSGYANLNARVPPEALPDLRRAVLALGLEVQSDSTSSSDITSQYRMLVEQLADLERAADHLRGLLSEARDPGTTDSLILLHDLLKDQIRSLQGQLDSYQESAGLASFDVSLNQVPMVLPQD